MSDILLAEQASPATPSAGTVLLYPKADGMLYCMDDAGTETPLGVPALFSSGGTGTGLIVLQTAPTILQPIVENLVLDAGGPSAGQAQLYFTPSPTGPLTVAEEGALEYDGAFLYATIDSVHGQGNISPEYFHYMGNNGAAIGPGIASFFGAGDNIPLIPSAIYEIEFDVQFLKTTAGTVTFTLTNSAAPTAMSVDITISPATGVVAAPTGADGNGHIVNSANAAQSLGASASLTTAVNHCATIKVFLENDSGTSLTLNVTSSAGTVTPLRGSRWKAKRVDNIGNIV
jgi:hypothetical protein